jgi:DnaJ-domain-containing protein 1
MAVSWHEIAAIAVGLGGGYWLVGRIIEGRGDAPQGPRQDGPEPVAASGSPLPWWEVLGVPRIATRDEVAGAYARRIEEYHPDKVARMGEEMRALAERRLKEINAAYDEAMRCI